LCGIEGHVCVQQTALDLLREEYEVFLVCDAVSSQRPYDRTVALNRLRDAGAILTTTESIIFDLMRDAKNPQFRTISGMIKKAKEVPDVHLFDSQNTL
jgi:isochorismate hydrolase